MIEEHNGEEYGRSGDSLWRYKNVLGLTDPARRVPDHATFQQRKLRVDTRDAALVESGDVVQGIREGRFGPDHIVAEIGQVAATPVLGRTSEDQVTIFKSLGMAVEDVAAADLAYKRASKLAKGAAIG